MDATLRSKRKSSKKRKQRKQFEYLLARGKNNRRSKSFRLTVDNAVAESSETEARESAGIDNNLAAPVPSTSNNLEVEVVHDSQEASNVRCEDESSNSLARKFHRHAVYFYTKLKEAETNNVPSIDAANIVDLGEEIGRGRFGSCSLASYGGRKVVVKKNFLKVDHEARIMAKLHHPNLVQLIGTFQAEPGNIAMVTVFYNVDGKVMNLCDLIGSEELNWIKLFKGLFQGLDYLHEKAKALHNDIKSDNVVLQGTLSNNADILGILVDFGKARDVCSPKSYSPPADLDVYRHLAPEIGKEGGKQSRKSDVYSMGYLIKRLSVSFEHFPVEMHQIYRVCLRPEPSDRPTAEKVSKILTRMLLSV